jgi:hypothetical protein
MEDTDAIPWTSGVKQGCPLSTLLFKTYLEQLLRRLKPSPERGYGINSEYLKDEISHSVLSYADDLILLSENKQDVHELIPRS